MTNLNSLPFVQGMEYEDDFYDDAGAQEALNEGACAADSMLG